MASWSRHRQSYWLEWTIAGVARRERIARHAVKARMRALVDACDRALVVMEYGERKVIITVYNRNEVQAPAAAVRRGLGRRERVR